MAITNAFRILFLWVSCSCFFLSRILQRRILIFAPCLIVPVAVAFTTFPPNLIIKHSFELRGELHQTASDNNNNNNYNHESSRRFLVRRNEAWLQKMSPTTQRRRRRRQGNHRLITLQLGATITGRTPEPEVGAEQTTSAADAATKSTQQQQTTTRSSSSSGSTKNKMNRYDKLWLEQLENLKAFRNVHGHCNVPQKQKQQSDDESQEQYDQQRQLGTWVNKQRMAFKENKIRKDRKALLDEIGFIWDTRIDSWQRNYNELRDYMNANGHCKIPRRRVSSGNNNGEVKYNSLGWWVDEQRRLLNRDELSTERIELLDKIGFSWSPQNELWQNQYKQLKEFWQLHGHVTVPHDNPLNSWTSKQRLNHAAGRLDTNQKARLDELGFVWEDPILERQEKKWLNMFHELEEYKLRKGHVKVPVAKSSSLGHWVSKQRKDYYDGHLLPHRQAKLESVGFIWTLRTVTEVDTTKFDKKWMIKYEALRDFQKEHGHANVPRKDTNLGHWVDYQRTMFRSGKMRTDRRELLEDIGFEFEIGKKYSDKNWKGKYEELQLYKTKFGNLNVSRAENSTLNSWMYEQRKRQQAGRLGSKEKEILDQLGMEW